MIIYYSSDIEPSALHTLASRGWSLIELQKDNTPEAGNWVISMTQECIRIGNEAACKTVLIGSIHSGAKPTAFAPDTEHAQLLLIANAEI